MSVHHDRRMTRRLENGRCDAFVVWAERRDDALALQCVVMAGAHRGEVVDIVSRAFATSDELAFVGLPCTLTVDGDDIRVEIER